VVGPDCALPSLLAGKPEGAELAEVAELKMLTIATAAVPATTLALIVIMLSPFWLCVLLYVRHLTFSGSCTRPTCPSLVRGRNDQAVDLLVKQRRQH